MGLNYLEELAEVCPKYDDIEEPGCDAADLLWLRYLAYSRFNGKQLSTSNIKVPVGNDLIYTLCIFKENEEEYRTGFVLQSPQHPELEGVILDDRFPHIPLRPFCVQADYETIVPECGKSLRKAVEKIGLSYYVENGLAHLLGRLLFVNKLSQFVGEHFWDNLQTYGDFAIESGLVRETWQDT